MSVNMKSMEKQQRGAARKERKNAVVEMLALDDKDAIFGKAIKALGGGMFRVAIPHAEHKHELIEVTAKTVDKNMARICVNDLVIVVMSGKTYELKGNLSSKNAKTLAIEKRLHPALIENTNSEGGCGIEFEVEEKNGQPSGDGDIDINAI